MLRNSIDRADRRILTELQLAGRISNVELASRVGLSPSPCLARVKQLEEKGIVSQYVALLDPENIGSTISVFIQISLKSQNEKNLENFEKVVIGLPEVMECYLMSGDADYLLRVVVTDTVALRNFVLDKLTKIEEVSSIRSSFALKQVKYKTALPIDQLWPDH
ncbi:MULTISPECIES: Lrp/AsnC family transcriptional regulator [Microvirga]|uniref:Lrp/AsnC family transcriptional regulator n=1 Tax=Microvirga TaxID=186650 RepID=UPI001B36CA13|nr:MULTISPECIES: Lrp/AsnC family transcriptional regulator [unclassified Microvirga]MBQ0819425.1 Lrp/AsnC family transcriptional regulator [Microvirga sp. HBU67558]